MENGNSWLKLKQLVRWSTKIWSHGWGTENGRLEFWRRNWPDAVKALDWSTRFKIPLRSALELAFLHGHVRHIIHRDIKLSNILLDGNFEPRVSDFGLAKLISASESRVIYHLSIARLWRLQPRETSTTFGWWLAMFELITGRSPTGQADVARGNLVGWLHRESRMYSTLHFWFGYMEG